MNDADRGPSNPDFLGLIESYNLIGSWEWSFASNDQVWSSGFYRLLGLEPGLVRPTYELFLSLVHPEDRAVVETGVQVRQEGILRDRVVRVIRPDGSMRILSSRAEVYFTPEGRPSRAIGIVLDVTDSEQMLRIQAAQSQRRRTLFEQARTFQNSWRSIPSTTISRELIELTGVPEADLLEDIYQCVVVEERAHWMEQSHSIASNGMPSVLTPTLLLANGQKERFTTVLAPMRNAHGAIDEWISLTYPSHRGFELHQGRLLSCIEQNISGRHLRAARALLDWSMTDLAEASGVSLSTIRRLEDNAEGPAARSRHVAIAAMRRAGIQFFLGDGGSVAVAKH